MELSFLSHYIQSFVKKRRFAQLSRVIELSPINECTLSESLLLSLTAAPPTCIDTPLARLEQPDELLDPLPGEDLVHHAAPGEGPDTVPPGVPPDGDGDRRGGQALLLLLPERVEEEGRVPCCGEQQAAGQGPEQHRGSH